jgi:tRNA pseudouridine synthase 10
LTESLEQEINNSTCDSTAAVTSAPVNVHSLLMLTQSNNGGIMSMLNTGAEDKRKTYRCVVWFERAISSKEIDELHAKHNTGNEAHDTLTIEQKTPVRVLHRRTLDTRIKYIHSIHIVEQHNAHYCTVDLCTSAGTYVKEFVGGDFGRTRPSFGDLFGCDAEILQLDVMSVDMKF